MKFILKTNSLSIERTSDGIPRIRAKSDRDMYYGLGYCHAVDRGMQMTMMKILGSGTASEHLSGDDEMLEVDKFFRKMNWQNGVEAEVKKLSSSESELLEAYCEGVNDGFAKSKPWELKLLLGYKNFRWEKEDVALMARMAGYLTLAQSQGEIERFFVEMVQKGVSKDLLDELFPDILAGFDEDLIRKVKLGDKIVPDAVKWNVATPAFMASNNWVISGSRTQSGGALLANDPHLEINRLPAVWYEIAVHVNDRYAFSATMPGLSALLICRKENLAWGATYTFMDAIDSWVEQCKDGKYLKDGEWHAFRERKEVIKRKKKEDVVVSYFENDHGVLDGNPHQEGHYLATRWSGQASGAQTIAAAFDMWNAQNVKEGMDIIGKLELSFSWVLADNLGNIGFQMSGLMPMRKAGWKGFVPLEGWKSENDWQGYHAPSDLPRSYNPESGYIITTNNNLNHLGKVSPINMPMGEYRADRIKQLIDSVEKSDLKSTQEIHYDTYSPQAELFMAILKPLLPDSENGKILKSWDLGYDVNSKGAFLFEMIYRSLYHQVFGKCLGMSLVEFLQNESGIIIDFYANFDSILLSKESKWFSGKSQTEIFQNALDTALSIEAKTWGSINQIELSHILLGGKFPKFFGFDKGPFALPGGRATVQQGQVYNSAGRKTSFAPSFRLIADMSQKSVHTNLSGGVSDRRFSSLYNSDFQNWADGIYKEIKF